MTNEQRAAQKAQLDKQMQAQARSLESASVMQPGDTRQSIGPQYAGSAQNAPPTPPPDPIVQHERELAYNSRFASNFAFSTERVAAEVKGISVPQQAGVWPEAMSGNAPGPSPTPASGQPSEKRHASVNVNSAEGQPYVLFEGTELETALVNRLDGDFSGPVKVMVTNPVYSHDRQHVLVPEGTFALGETSKVQGFGQRRLAVVFHRLIMPDGYTVDLDQFHGLNQIGETGLKDQVNHHYFEIFGSSIALGIIAGAAHSSNRRPRPYQTRT